MTSQNYIPFRELTHSSFRTSDILPTLQQGVRLNVEKELQDDSSVKLSSAAKIRCSMDKYASFKVRDFSIDNLAQSGAINMLRPLQLHGDDDVSLDNAERLVDAVEAAESAALSQVSSPAS